MASSLSRASSREGSTMERGLGAESNSDLLGLVKAGRRWTKDGEGTGGETETERGEGVFFRSRS